MVRQANGRVETGVQEMLGDAEPMGPLHAHLHPVSSPAVSPESEVL